MELTVPKTPPPPPEGAHITFHFPGDSFRPGTPLPALKDALAAVRAELTRLRAVIAAGEGTRPLAVLDRADADARADGRKASAAADLSQRQFAGGVIEEAEALAIQAVATRARASIHAIGVERQRRAAADEAAAEIHRIHEATE